MRLSRPVDVGNQVEGSIMFSGNLVTQLARTLAQRLWLLVVPLAMLNAACAGLISSPSKPATGGSTPLTVSITSLASGETVSGTITVTATASDNVAVASVQFQVDGSNLGAVDTSAPYSVSLNTTTLANGKHSLTALAIDTAGKKGTSPAISIAVNNGDSTPPTVSITSPASGATVSGTITVIATASGNVAVASVQFQVDGSNLGAAVTSAPYSVSLNTTTLANGADMLIAIATDTSNNKTTSAPVSIIVNNSSPNQPTVSITSPLAGTTVSGTITVTATASDSNGIASVQFQLDGSNLAAADTASPYSQSWNTTTVADGTHILTAVATSNDSSQQPATASAVVIVNNSGSGPFLSATPGWHKIPATALAGNSEGPKLCVPDNFPNNLNAAYTSYGFGFSDTCYAEYDDSSTAILDTTRNRLIFWGGGHNVYHGNDLFDLEINNIGVRNPVLIRLTNPANPFNPVGGTGQAKYESMNPCYSPLGTYVSGCTPTHVTPGPRHTYNNLAYIPKTDQMFSMGGALIPNGGQTNVTWFLQMGSVLASCAPGDSAFGCDPIWTSQMTSLPTSNVNQVNYDPYHNGVWMITGDNTIAFFNLSSQTWFTNTSSISVGYHNMSVLDPVDQLFISAGLDGIYYFSTANPGATQLTITTPTTTGCSLLLNGYAGTNPQYPGIAWDPIAKVVVAYPNGGNQLVLLDPKTWTCTTETYGSTQGTDYPQNTPGTTTSGDEGTFGHFQYVPAYDIFVLCNDSSNDCWYLRPNR